MNQGQTDPAVRFLTRGPGYALLLTDTGAVFAWSRDKASDPDRSQGTLRLEVEGGLVSPQVTGENKLVGRINYLRGNDRSHWMTGLPTYAAVRHSQVYPGVDLVHYSREGRLEFDFALAPGADPSTIRLKVSGTDPIHIDDQGRLELGQGDRRLVFQKPLIYQEIDGRRLEVAGGFRLLDKARVGFTVGNYDRTRPLVIDPVLEYHTLFGGSAEDVPQGVAVAGDGSAYVVGWTDSAVLPDTAGGYQTTNGGGLDAFVIKLTPDATAVDFVTFLGGSEDDSGEAIILDGAGDAYIVGTTASANFPVTAGAYDTSHGGGINDAFISKIGPAGDTLIYSTFLGGSGNDFGWALARDGAGDINVAGITSGAFPTTAGSFQTIFGGGSWDAFVAKLDATLTVSSYATYLGGSGNERSTYKSAGIAVDASNQAFVTGTTTSADFPATVGAYDTTYNGSEDIFAVKLDAAGSSLLYATYLGSSGYENGKSIAVDDSGYAYVCGYGAGGYPTTAGAVQTAFGGGNYDIVATKLNTDGSGLIYSTFLGGSSWDWCNSIAVNGAGEVYLTGATFGGLLTTGDAFQTTFQGGRDEYLTILNSTGTALVYSTYFGSASDEDGYGLALDATGGVYLTSYCRSTHVPATTGAYQDFYAGGIADASIAKFAGPDTTPPVVSATSPGDGDTGVALDTLVTATFSEAMAPATIDTGAFYLNGGIMGSVAYDAPTRTATFTPSSNLGPNLVYTATVTTGAQDLAGNGLAGDFIWTFTTGNGLVAKSFTVAPGSTAEAFRLLALPVTLDDSAAWEAYAQQFEPYDITLKRIGFWDPSLQNYVEFSSSYLPPMPVSAGQSAWFLFRNGQTINVQGSPPAITANPYGDDSYMMVLYPGWNMIGNPWSFAVNVNDIVVRDSGGAYYYLTDTANTVTQQVFWAFDNGAYTTPSTLGAMQGGWLYKLTPDTGRVYFPVVAPDLAGDERDLEPAPDLEPASDLERPPDPPSALSSGSGSSSSGGGSGGGCFISTLWGQ
jgi:hypothetical protein